MRCFVFVISGVGLEFIMSFMSFKSVRIAWFIAAIFIFGIFLSMNASAQRRFYMAPDDHTDYYWTADGNTYRQAFLTMIDYYLDKMDATQGNPSDTQMRWN